MIEATVSKGGSTKIRERFVSQNGERMFVRDAGEAGSPAILLLHDLATTGATFEPLMEQLSDRYHLIAPDLVGFGRSGRPSDEEFGYRFPRLGCYAGTIMTKDLGIGSYAVYAQGSAGPAGTRGRACGARVTGWSEPGWRRRCTRR